MLWLGLMFLVSACGSGTDSPAAVPDKTGSGDQTVVPDKSGSGDQTEEPDKNGDDTTVTADNQSPVLEISAPQQAKEREEVRLSVSASDAEGHGLKYLWRTESALAFEMNGFDGAELLVKSPDIQKDTTVTFSVTVTDELGASSEAAHQITFKRNELALQLTGQVTDKPVAHAHVVATIGDTQFVTQADAQGFYTLPVTADESDAQALVRLTATGTGEQQRVVFVSQLSTLASLVDTAGEDGVLAASELHDVNVTNVTTAEFAQLQQMENAFDSAEQLKVAKRAISTRAKYEQAILLKVLVDHDMALLPEGISSTLELASNLQLSEQLFAELSAALPDVFEQTQAALFADCALTNTSEQPLSGDYYLTLPEKFNHLLLKLSFNSDGTGTLLAEQAVPFSWQQQGQTITFTFDTSSIVIGKLNWVKYTLESLQLTVLEGSEPYIEVQTEFGYSMDFSFSEHIQKQSQKAYGQLIPPKSLLTFNAAELIGTWQIQHYAFNSELGQLQQFEFLADGQARQVSNAQVWQWQLSDNSLVLSNNTQTLTFRLLQRLPFGLKFVATGSLASHHPMPNQAVFVKQQDTDFSQIDFTGQWQTQFQLNNYEQHVFYDNHFYRRSIREPLQWRVADDKVIVEGYLWFEQQVQHCDLSHPACELQVHAEFELLAYWQDKLAVRYTYPNEHWMQENNVPQHYLAVYSLHQSETQNALSVLSDFTYQKWYSTNNDPMDNFILDMDCPSLGGMCVPVIEHGTKRYDVEARGSLLLLTDRASAEHAVLEITAVTATEYDICIRKPDAVCNSANTSRYSQQGPLRNIEIEIEGNGQVVAHSDTFNVGQPVHLSIEPGQGYAVGEVSGCEGYYEPDRLVYSIYETTQDCVVSAVFVRDNGLLGQVRLLQNDDYFPRYFDFQVNSDGTGRLSSVEWQFVEFNWDYLGNHGLSATLVAPRNTYTGHLDTIDGQSVWLNHYLVGFDIQPGPADQLEVNWHLEYRIADVVHQTVRKTDVLTDSRKITPVALAEPVGSWLLAQSEYGYYFAAHRNNGGYFSHGQNPILLTLAEGGTGSISNWPLGDEQEAENTVEIEWEQSEAGILITNKTRYEPQLQLTPYEAVDGGLRFNVIYPDDLLSGTSLGRSGFMVKQQPGSVAISDYAGMWRFVTRPQGPSFAGLEVYESGVVRSGSDYIGTRVSMLPGELLLEDYIAEGSGEVDPDCHAQRSDCKLNNVVKHQIIARAPGRLFTVESWPALYPEAISTSMLRIIEHGDIQAFTRFEPYMLLRTELFELVDGTDPIRWSFHRDWDGNGRMLSNREGSFPITLNDNGQIEYSHHGETYYIALLSASEDGLLVCKYSQYESCDDSRQIFLSYESRQPE